VRLAFLILLAASALVAAGCGAVAHISSESSGDATKGKTLFKDTCGSCHTLADAKTAGTIGPNLDDAFVYAKKQGFDESTIRDVVRGQIAYAEPSTGAGIGGRKPPGIEYPGMPDNLLRGQDAVDVAIYVAKCAGTPDCGVK
jgi:mono/diheme cytochrome c family protein